MQAAFRPVRQAARKAASEHGRTLREVDARILHRLLDQAKTAAALRHPSIPWVHDLGIGPGGIPFYTVRLVRGRTLLEEFERAQLGDRRRLLDVLLRAAETVAHAHAHGVLHRDLEPANIAVGQFGEVAVLGWGLARTDSVKSSSPGETIRISRSIDP